MNYYKIKTHKGDTLLLIEVPLDAMGIELISRLKSAIVNEEHNDLWYYTKKSDDMILVALPKNNYELIGTTSTLTDKQANDLVEYFELESVYKNYNPNSIDDYWKFNTALESWESFLQANNIDTTKNYCILKILKNE